jgi:hypothetical protein
MLNRRVRGLAAAVRTSREIPHHKLGNGGTSMYPTEQGRGPRHSTKNRVVVIAALLAVLGAVFGVSATTAQASSTTHYTIHNLTRGCITDPGHGNVVYVRFNCGTTFTFTNPVTTDGYTWYLLRINGGADCLNYDPGNGFVYNDSCIPNDPNELWEHHSANALGNLAPYLDTLCIGSFCGGPPALAICNNTPNARLMIFSLIFSRRCHFTSHHQSFWIIKPS